jgi:alanyl-tRNA synthetase
MDSKLNLKGLKEDLNQILFEQYLFKKKECKICSCTFWSADSNAQMCGNSDCNLQYNRSNFQKKDLSLKQVVKFFNEYYTSVKIPGFNRAILLIRGRMASKYSTTNMSFICAGASAFEAFFYDSEGSIDRKKLFSKNLLVNTQFCYRFLDQKNVAVTRRHSTGFFMSGIHAFESKQDHFELNWQQKIIVATIGFFVTKLGIDAKALYLHADFWTDSVRGGNSVETYVDGIEVGNMVFTTNNLSTQKPLETKYLDMGLGIERIFTLISTRENVYFMDPIKDHLRSVVVGIKDGIYPCKVGVGYNLRKLIEIVLAHYNYQLKEVLNATKFVLADLSDLLDQAFMDRDLEKLIINILKEEIVRCKSSSVVK